MTILIKAIALCSTLLLFWVPAAAAHKDTVLAVKEGNIEGLPEKYQPATYDSERYILRIGTREMAFAPYLKSLFTERNDWDMSITASWYHKSWSLPPYICFHLKPGERDYGYDVLIDMDTLKLIRITAILNISNSETRYAEIQLPRYVRKQIYDSVHRVARQLKAVQ